MARRRLLVAVLVAGLGMGAVAAWHAYGPGSQDDGSGAAGRPAASARAEAKRLLESAMEPVDPARREAETQDYARRRDESLDRCMRETGFSYRPVQLPPPARVKLGLSEEDFIKRHGFGISTLIDFYGSQAVVDPNRQLRDSLSATARKAYDEAFRRCEEAMLRELGPGPGRLRLPVENGVQSGILDVSRQVAADPRVAAATNAYQMCVAEWGFSGQSGEALRGQIEARVKPFREAYEARRDELVRQGREVTGLRIADVLDPGQMDELRQLQQLELSAAAADRACGAPLYQTTAAVQREYMRRYLDGLD